MKVNKVTGNKYIYEMIHTRLIHGVEIWRIKGDRKSLMEFRGWYSMLLMEKDRTIKMML
jgi:hypothetical protein